MLSTGGSSSLSPCRSDIELPLLVLGAIDENVAHATAPQLPPASARSSPKQPRPEQPRPPARRAIRFEPAADGGGPARPPVHRACTLGNVELAPSPRGAISFEPADDGGGPARPPIRCACTFGEVEDAPSPRGAACASSPASPHARKPSPLLEMLYTRLDDAPPRACDPSPRGLAEPSRTMAVLTSRTCSSRSGDGGPAELAPHSTHSTQSKSPVQSRKRSALLEMLYTGARVAHPPAEPSDP